MKTITYLKKDINWNLAAPTIEPSGAASLIKNNIGFFRSELKKICLAGWCDNQNMLITSEQRNHTDRIFHSNETFEFAASVADWVIPMDDDDALHIDRDKFTSILANEKHKPDIVIWDCYEYDFITGLYRIDHRLKKSDIPEQLQDRIHPILPGSYAISDKFARRILKENMVADAVNFFTAIDLFIDMGAKIKFLDETWCCRPYTHFCEYYISTQTEINPVFNYNYNPGFFYKIENLYKQILQCEKELQHGSGSIQKLL